MRLALGLVAALALVKDLNPIRHALSGGFDAQGVLPLAALLAPALLALRTRKLDSSEALAAAALLWALLHGLVEALAPPTAWDVLAYHLALPKIYAEIGGIVEIPWMIHSHWPHLMELLYARLLGLGELWPAVLHLAACAGWIATFFIMARDALGARAAFLGAALLAAQPAVLELAGTAHSDGPVALFHLLSVSVLWRHRERLDARALAAAGLLSGLAAACKLIGAAPALGLAFWVWRRAGPRAAAMFGACAFVAPLPFYMRSWLEAGNPVWPFFPELFGGKYGGPALVGPYLESARWTLGDSPAALLRYGPQWLLLPAAVGFIRARGLPPVCRLLACGALPLALLSVRQHEFWRFMLPAYPLLALLAAKGAPPLPLAAWALAASVTVSHSNELYGALALKPSVDDGRPRREQYLSRRLDYYDFFQEASRAIPPGGKILLFREIRGYHLDAPYLWGDPLNQGIVDYAKPGSLGCVASHLLINRRLGAYRPRPGYYEPAVVAAVEALGKPVLERDGLLLRELPPCP